MTINVQIVSVCRLAQGGGHRVAPQPGPAGFRLDLRVCQFSGQQLQIAGWSCILLSLLQ